MIKSVIFDLGQVIVPFDFNRGFQAMAAVCHHPPEEIRRRLFSNGLVASYELGEVSSESFVRDMCRILGLQVGYEDFSDLWCSIFLPQTLIPEELILRLRGRYRLLLLSNTNEIHFNMLERSYPLLRHFDDFILSHHVHLAKPSPAIFRTAVARAGCRPEECFFTDDIAENVVAAREEGLDAVQFLSLAQLEAELRARNILS